MAVYPDKKAGKLNGRWRVELQRSTPNGTERYRQRWDNHADAVKDEKAVKAAWARGDVVNASNKASGSPDVHTFASVMPLAEGMLWEGQRSADVTWARLRLMRDILGANTRLDDVDTHSVDKIIQRLQKEGKADGTINRYLSHLRTFLTWAKGRKYRTLPIADIEFAWRKESVGRIRWVTAEEEAQLHSFLSNKAPHVWKLVKVAIETGCRREELLSAELNQINGDLLHLWETKTDTPRTIPMHPETTALLRDLITSGTMPSERNLRSWWERAKVAMGLEDDDEFVFHTCRHTRATRLVDAGINIFVIKEWMGHKVIQTTMRYAHVKPQNLQDALARVGYSAPGAPQNPQVSAVPDLPTAYPTGGGMGHFSQAA